MEVNKQNKQQNKMEKGNMDDVIQYIKDKYPQKESVKYIEICKTGFFCFDVTRNTLIQCDSEHCARWQRNKGYVFKFITFKKCKLMLKMPEWVSQSIYSDIKSTFDFITSSISATISTYSLVSAGCKQEEFAPWLVDVLSLFSEIVDPYAFGPKRVLLMLTRLYSIIKRFVIWKNVYYKKEAKYEAESLLFASFSDVIASFSLMQMPSYIVDMIKTFNFLTGKRIQDSKIFMDISVFTVNIVYETMVWFQSFGIIDLTFILTPLKTLNDYVSHYSTLKEVTELHSMFIKDQRCMLDHEYRIKVLEVSKKVNTPEFKEYFLNDNNKFILQLIPSFLNNIVRYAETFMISSKDEPILIVLSGKPGCGKSVLMNAVVSYLRSKYCNKSVYVHTVPCTDAGKDFYDDYMNQEVFVMDDVGQQGNSQWRQMINFVSPVKYPLDCAAAEKKNTKFFNSKIIICTTNKIKDLRFTTTDGVADATALYRRAHVLNITALNDNMKKISYEKYDYENTQTWRNEFIEPYGNCKEILEPNFESNRLLSSASWIVKLIERLTAIQTDIASEVTLNDKQLQEMYEMMTDEKNVFFDAEAIEFSQFSSNIFDSELPLWNAMTNGFDILKEYVEGLSRCCLNMINGTGIVQIFQNLISDSCKDSKSVVLTALVTAAFAGVIYYFIRSLTASTPIDELNQLTSVIEEWKRMQGKKNVEKCIWKAESGEDVASMKIHEHFKFVEIRSSINGKEVLEMCQAIVSGDKIILPDHVVGLNPIINVYKNWDAKLNNTMELEQVRLTVIRIYTELDLVICRFEGLAMPLYKKAHRVFNYRAPSSNKSLRFMNCYHNIPLDTIGNFRSNKEDMNVRSLKGSKLFPKGTGVEYSISYNGLCGSALVSDSQGVVGFHVAGNGTDGFAVLMSASQREEIRDVMLQGVESKFDLHPSVKSNFSGARMRYVDGQVEVNHAKHETNLTKTQLHAEVNDKVDELMNRYRVEPKYPPNFNKYGSTRNTLNTISVKAFEPMGNVDAKELEYAKKVLDSFIIPFKDITLEESIFGNEELNSIKLDTANGYGWKEKKTDLFDKQTKTISDKFLTVYNDFLEQCEVGDVDFKNYIARDTFKDELRPLGKDPRVFRVLPVQHMIAMKQCLGNLMIHIRNNVKVNGIAIGMNPYKDWDELYKRMKSMKICSDIDFEKWDKKLHALVQEAVNDVVLGKYEGDHRKLLEFLLKSVVRGIVLVGDEVLSTTHSMPSGSWVTALFNSFVNKMISAMAFYRAYVRKYAKEPTVEEFHELLDYVMGDDKLMGAPEKFADVFNALTVQEIANDLGMTCTDGLKRKITRPYTPLDEITFLKRNFVFHPSLGKYVGPLAIGTLVNTVQWYDSSKDYDVVMQGKLTAVQIEAYLHSPKLRDELYYIGKTQLPCVSKVSDEDIQRIMNGDDGYAVVQRMLGKDFLY